MMRSLGLWIALSCLAAPAALLAQETRRSSIDVDHYKIDARIDVERQTLQATAADESVEQRGFSGVRPADDGDEPRLELWLGFCIRFCIH
jgi:hypothetical protein